MENKIGMVMRNGVLLLKTQTQINITFVANRGSPNRHELMQVDAVVHTLDLIALVLVVPREAAK